MDPAKNEGGGAVDGELRSFPWVRLGALMLAIVSVPTGPLWMSHIHLLQEFGRVKEVATNPHARPEAYTASMFRQDKAEMREWVNGRIDLEVAKLRQAMPPHAWQARIRALEREVIRQNPEYQVPPE